MSRSQCLVERRRPPERISGPVNYAVSSPFTGYVPSHFSIPAADEDAGKDADAALRNSRARRLHQIIRRPGRGGLTAKGAEQLQMYFSKKATEAGRLSLGPLDESARTVMLQMAAEEVDTEGLSYGDLRQVAEELMVNRAGDGKGGEGGDEKTTGDVGTRMSLGAEGDQGLQEEHKQGDESWAGDGVALFNEFKLCIRSKEQGGAAFGSGV